MRFAIATMVLAIAAGVGCPAAGTPNQTKTAANSSGAGGVGGAGGNAAAGSSAATKPPDPFTPVDKIKPERRVVAYLDGHRRVLDIDEARSYGFTIVDLSDDWVPYIFWSKTPDKDDFKSNRYQLTYVRLANDRINVDGARLRRWQRNYLEVYGIPPTLSVLRKRFVNDEKKACFKEIDYDFWKKYHGPIRAVDRRTSRFIRRRYRRYKRAYKKALRKARVSSLDELLQKRRYRRVARLYRLWRWRWLGIAKFQNRLQCEGLFGRRRRGRRYKPGYVNWVTRQSLRRFERKHNVYGYGIVYSKTAKVFARTPRENNFESLKRLLRERVIGAAGVLEDGTVRASYVGEDGQRHRVRNLVKEMADAVVKQMGLTDADKAHAWITKHKPSDFKRLFIAVKLPKLPEYYSKQMDFRVVIDRGDVWYDLPFDDKGKRVYQPRKRMPKFTLYVKYKSQTIPLVRWRTTIGGWNKEMRNGEEFYKYKISDVGKRIWRNIVAGPAWVPPKKTPPTDMIKYRVVGGRAQRVVGQSTFGPGYASAYGLAAAYHITKGGHDNQIRTHGSVNYMSIRRSFSHGCHRLYNFRAVRLYSFVLRHRAFVRQGQRPIGVAHRFEYKGEEFQINMHTRGYFYKLTPPVKVEVLKGRIQGKRKDPYKDYVKKPGKVYQSDLPGHKGTRSVRQRQTL